MVRRITIVVPEPVAERLDLLARASFRDRKQQAAVMLVDAIRREERRAAARASREPQAVAR